VQAGQQGQTAGEDAVGTARRPDGRPAAGLCDLVNRYSHIAFEDLNITGLAIGMLAKSVLNAAWGQLISFTDYKAANAGGLVTKVNPRGTSQECDGCGMVTPKTLSERIHDCPSCGTVEDRDVHAAKVIKHRAFPWSKGPGAGLEASSQRVAA
jgi:putative transposase